MYPPHKLALEVLAFATPPAKLTLSEWAENNFVLAEGSSARPGRFRLWPYQRDPMDAMGDPEIERVTFIKSARIGYTKSLMAAIAASVATDPCAMILLVPTDDDARGYAVDEIEPAFDQSPALQGLLNSGRIDGRNTLTTKSFIGDSLKILSARSPRNLRRHDAKRLYIDEEDGMEVTQEGDPIVLAEKRTLAHADRKIIRGSTPTDEISSTISRAYLQSDQRVFEIPCPHCGALFELMWEHIVWPKGQPDEARAVCPHCLKEIDERFKSQMVHEGRWRVTRPDIRGHAGFRINTLVSLLANARWGKLAEEFERARKGGPSELQVFTNTVLGKVWKTSLDDLDESSLRQRVEDFGIIGADRLPADVLLIVAGVDTQDDRFEVGLWGFNESEAFFLAHQVVWGDPADSVTQAELDALLRTTWKHPNGWTIGIEGAAIDSQGHKTQAVYDFCAPRLSRKIFPIISRVGTRKMWAPSKAKADRDRVRIFIVGHDETKTRVLERLSIPMVDEQGTPSVGRLRYSNDLPEETFEQLTSEKRVLRYVKNRPVVEFRPKKPGLRNEALDITCYAFALRQSMKINFAERRTRRAAVARPVPKQVGSRIIAADDPFL
jgi:phage terminase large subunit GpA-like protein